VCERDNKEQASSTATLLGVHFTLHYSLLFLHCVQEWKGTKANGRNGNACLIVTLLLSGPLPFAIQLELPLAVSSNEISLSAIQACFSGN
jgi:hypothetical protein